MDELEGLDEVMMMMMMRWWPDHYYLPNKSTPILNIASIT